MMSPETYGAFYNTALDIARQRGMNDAIEFIFFEMNEQDAKMTLAHVINAVTTGKY